MVKLKPILTLLKILLLGILLVGIFLVIWLRQGEKTLNWAKPALLSSINAGSSGYNVAIGDLTIDWRDLSKLGLLHARNVTIAGRDGAVFATLPEMYIGLDPLGFLPKRRLLHTVVLPNPKVFLTRDKDKILRLGLEGSDTATPISTLQSDESKPGLHWDGSLPFRRLRVEDAGLVITDEVTGSRLESPRASLLVARAFGRYNARLELPFTHGDDKGRLNVTLRTIEADMHRATVEMSRLPSQYICLFMTCPGQMELEGNINGRVEMQLNDAMEPQSGEAKLSTQTLTVISPAWFPEPIKVKQAEFEVDARAGMKVVEVKKLEMALVDTNLTANATAEHKKDGWYVQGQGRADELAIDKLYKYWPLTLAPDSREFVTGSLSDGAGVDATIRFDLTPEDFENPELRDEAIESTIQARNITVHYLPGFPPMKNVNGTVKFTAATMDIQATSGTMLSGTTIRRAHIICPDLNNPATPMEITTDLDAPAADAANLLQLKYFTFDDALELNPKTINGSVEGILKLKFDAFSKDKPNATPVAEGEINFDEVVYDVAMTLKNISQPKLAGSIDIRNASGELTANPEGMKFVGKVSSGPATLNVTATQKSGSDVELALDGSIARAQFSSLGLPDDQRFGEGTMGIDASVIAMRDTLQLKTAAADLSDIAIRIPEISWEKPRGAAAKITVTPKGNHYALNINAKGLSAPNATLKLGSDLGVKELIFPRVRTSRSDFGVQYKVLKDGFDATINGNTLDASMSYTGSGDGSENNLLADFPAMKLAVDLNALVLMPNAPFSNVKGTLHCTSARCESANIRASAGRGDILARITKASGQRQFLLTASDAGDFLRALDITDRMYGGKLELKGTYDDRATPPALPARLFITDFTLRNSQILARILTIGSLSGLANALTGKGIDFEKIAADIYSQGGTITVTDGKASGNAIGITVGGMVDTKRSSLDLRGTLAPAYAINSLIANIPILGELAGGSEGLIAFNYSVKGPYSDPSVMVNPLSGLTPGFLRGIWGNSQPKNPVSKSEATGEESPFKQTYPK